MYKIIGNFVEIDCIMKQKYALVTGGARGIGRAICLKLAEMGYPVIVGCHSNLNAAQEVCDAIARMGGSASVMKFDVGNKTEVETALGEWEQSHPDDYIACLVNNAGVAHDNLMFMMTDSDWESVMNTSVNGLFYVTRYLLPKMMARGHGGHIVNMSSLSGLKGLAGQTNYCAAKAAVIGATRALAQETASRNVTVNAVAPGFITTDMTKDLPEEELKKMIPMKRFGKPEEVAELVGFLCSDKASYITGEVISINGGLY